MQDDSFEDWQMPRPFIPKRDSLVNDAELLDEGICATVLGDTGVIKIDGKLMAGEKCGPQQKVTG